MNNKTKPIGDQDRY